MEKEFSYKEETSAMFISLVDTQVIKINRILDLMTTETCLSISQPPAICESVAVRVCTCASEAGQDDVGSGRACEPGHPHSIPSREKIMGQVVDFMGKEGNGINNVLNI